MNKSYTLRSLLYISLITLVLFISCDADVTIEKGGAENIEISIDNIYPGSFDISWEEVRDGGVYYIKITQEGELASDWYDGQTAYFETSSSIDYYDTEFQAGETYDIEVIAKSAMMGGSEVGKGTSSVTLPELPNEILGQWNTTSKGLWEFKADGTLIAPDYSSTNLTWTISEGLLVIIRHFETNLQFEPQNYTLSNDGKTLTLENNLTSYVIELTRI